MYRIKNENLDFKIDSLGECKQNNPLIDFYAGEGSSHFVNEKNKIKFSVYRNEDEGDKYEDILLEKAGPREKFILFPGTLKLLLLLAVDFVLALTMLFVLLCELYGKFMGFVIFMG